MVDYRKKLGKSGEDFASAFLESKGFEILERNFRCKFGEADIIARKDDVIHFCEVKTRLGAAPDEMYSDIQRKRLRELAEFYLADRNLDEQVSFNVIGVYGDPKSSTPSIEMIDDNFRF